ncbi:GNAT family N-acetyltransferase [Aquimonas voraii]|uniref:Ribosomal protein S18 acetylase RimI n=1 Tax=Aquimonas voraii TaxID=265719 RepID=A0A1G6UWW6_9GAMM|nr:GNAT family N-acetyltransferase [Aquimonas voraii]SDD45734.1 Ribosomal protein S18 acetylase RimI [Aquimonas voraii]
MSAGPQVRPQVAEDLPWLRELYASTRALELEGVAWPEAAKRAFLDQQFELQRTHFESFYAAARFLAVLSPEGEAIGRYIVLEKAPEHLIVDIALFPQWRGRGLGSALIRQSLDLADRQGAEIGLHVLKHNSGALRLYLRLGFKIVGDEGAHWRMRCSTDAPESSK